MQSDLNLSKSDPKAVKMEYSNEETMTEYFAMLKDVMTKEKLLNSLSQIYNNVDKTGMPLDHRPPKVIVKRGQNKVCCRKSGNRSQVTVIACVSTTGHAMPPYMIFDA